MIPISNDLAAVLDLYHFWTILVWVCLGRNLIKGFKDLPSIGYYIPSAGYYRRQDITVDWILLSTGYYCRQDITVDWILASTGYYPRLDLTVDRILPSTGYYCRLDITVDWILLPTEYYRRLEITVDWILPSTGNYIPSTGYYRRRHWGKGACDLHDMVMFSFRSILVMHEG